jgi:hypothetical protein
MRRYWSRRRLLTSYQQKEEKEEKEKKEKEEKKAEEEKENAVSVYHLIAYDRAVP